MAVAKWMPKDNLRECDLGPRNFPPPKRSDLRAWYREAWEVLHKGFPQWDESYRALADITEELITFDLDEGHLFIARKKYMP